MPGPPREPVLLTVDLTVIGDTAVIETRVPRSVYGKLHGADAEGVPSALKTSA